MFSSNIYFGSKMRDKYMSPLPNLGGGWGVKPNKTAKKPTRD